MRERRENGNKLVVNIGIFEGEWHLLHFLYFLASSLHSSFVYYRRLDRAATAPTHLSLSFLALFFIPLCPTNTTAQEAVLFSGTVRDNLFLGFPDLEPPHASIEEGLNFFPLLEPQQSFTFARGEDGQGAWDMEERMERVR